MCGRFVSQARPDQIADHFDAVPFSDIVRDPSWNVAPTDPVPAIAVREGERRLGTLRWGLVPWWASDTKIAARQINARAETLTTKNAYREAFQRRRCIVPADGFYEWRRVAGGKQPMFISRRDGDMLAFAGLWASWRGPDRTGERLVTCSIVTTTANDAIAPIHDRMPVLLPPAAWASWLDPDNDDTDTLSQLLVPAPSDLLVAWPVSGRVNSVRNNGPELMAEVPPDRLLDRKSVV